MARQTTNWRPGPRLGLLRGRRCGPHRTRRHLDDYPDTRHPPHQLHRRRRPRLADHRAGDAARQTGALEDRGDHRRAVLGRILGPGHGRPARTTARWWWSTGPGSRPASRPICVTDIRVQARALAPLLHAAPGQKILLVGQSYGAAIASLMAADNPARSPGVVMLSSFLGETGPTARWLVELGQRLLSVIPRDLRHAIMEVTGQAAQLTHMREALQRLTIPVHVIHGDKDDFAPIETAERLARELRTLHPIRFQTVPGANHFLNDGPTEVLLSALEACLPAEKAPAWRWPALPKFKWPFAPVRSPVEQAA